jgi:hypothetical protein
MPALKRHLLLVLAALSVAPRARADTNAACVEAAHQGQALRANGALRRAREALLECSAEVCPRVIRSDCTRWVAEVEASLPSIVVLASADGRDVADVSVALDGVPLLARLDGKAIPLDPGPHTLRASHGDRAVEEQILIGEGDKNRKVVVDFGRPAASSPQPDVPSERRPVSLPVQARRPPVLAWVAAGLGVAALGSFTYFAIDGKSDYRALERSCAPECSDADIGRSRDKLLVADVSLGVAAVSALVATILVLTSR